MRTIWRYATASALVAGLGISIATAQADNSASTIDGRWDANLISHGDSIPFRLDISGSGPTLTGTFYDGFDPYDGTTSATFENRKLVLNIEHYLTTITATLQDGKLVGNATTRSRIGGSTFDFEATRHVDAPASGVHAPSIAGSWIIPLSSPSAKGEKAFRFIVKQHGPEVAASVLRVDGDTGAYSGSYKDGKWVLSHFDGGRPGLIEVSLNDDGTLQIIQGGPRPPASIQECSNGGSTQTASAGANSSPYSEAGPTSGRYARALTAFREDIAKAKGIPAPDDYDTHTTARDPNEKFTFNFPDVNGKLVSQNDPRFEGKVVLAIVTGTWCPNCHDEAQYLVQLDKKYRDKGLAIVALDFEEPEQQGSLERERAFVKKYGVQYTYLIAGAPSDMWEKVPQLVNLNTWPATIFIGRDGKVKAVHSGFASPASGEFHADLEKEFTSRIEQLLAEKAGESVASSSAPSSKPGQ